MDFKIIIFIVGYLLLAVVFGVITGRRRMFYSTIEHNKGDVRMFEIMHHILLCMVFLPIAIMAIGLIKIKTAPATDTGTNGKDS